MAGDIVAQNILWTAKLADEVSPTFNKIREAGKATFGDLSSFLSGSEAGFSRLRTSIAGAEDSLKSLRGAIRAMPTVPTGGMVAGGTAIPAPTRGPAGAEPTLGTKIARTLFTVPETEAAKVTGESGKLAGAAVAAEGGVMRKFLTSLMSPFKALIPVALLVHGIMNVVEPVVSLLTDMMTLALLPLYNVMVHFVGFVQPILAGFSHMLSRILDFLQPMFTFLGKLWYFVENVLSDFLDSTGSFLKNVWSFLWGVLSHAFPNVAKALEALGDYYKQFYARPAVSPGGGMLPVMSLMGNVPSPAYPLPPTEVREYGLDFRKKAIESAVGPLGGGESGREVVNVLRETKEAVHSVGSKIDKMHGSIQGFVEPMLEGDQFRDGANQEDVVNLK